MERKKKISYALRRHSSRFLAVVLSFGLLFNSVPKAEASLPAVWVQMTFGQRLITMGVGGLFYDIASTIVTNATYDIYTLIKGIFSDKDDIVEEEIPTTPEEWVNNTTYWTQTYNYFTYMHDDRYDNVTFDEAELLEKRTGQGTTDEVIIDGWKYANGISSQLYFEIASTSNANLSYIAYVKDNILMGLKDPSILEYVNIDAELFDNESIAVKWENETGLAETNYYQTHFTSNVFEFSQDGQIEIDCNLAGGYNTYLASGISTNRKDGSHLIAYNLYKTKNFDYYDLTNPDPLNDFGHWEHVRFLNGTKSVTDVEKGSTYIIVATVFPIYHSSLGGGNNITEEAYQRKQSHWAVFPYVTYKIITDDMEALTDTSTSTNNYYGNVQNQYIENYYENGWNDPDFVYPEADGNGGGTGGGTGGDGNISGDINVNVDGGLDHNVSGGLDVNIGIDWPDWNIGGSTDPPEGEDGDSSGGGILNGFFAVLSKLLNVILTILEALLDFILDILDFLFGFVLDFLKSILDRFLNLVDSEYFKIVSQFFGWMPEEIQEAITMGILLIVLIGVLKVVFKRG